MIYDMECDTCGTQSQIICSLSEHAMQVKPGARCSCGGWIRQIFLGSRMVFAREAFPKNDPRWEHVSNEPIAIRDKVHLRDICQENGNISRYLEDAV